MFKVSYSFLSHTIIVGKYQPVYVNLPTLNVIPNGFNGPCRYSLFTKAHGISIKGKFGFQKQSYKEYYLQGDY